MRTIEKEIDDGRYKKKFHVHLIADTVARVDLWGRIFVSQDFFKLNHDEQLAALYHEEGHDKQSLKSIWWFIKHPFGFKKISWEREYDADIYASKKTNVPSVVSLLRKAYVAYSDGTTAYNENTHPPVSARIQNVKEGIRIF